MMVEVFTESMTIQDLTCHPFEKYLVENGFYIKGPNNFQQTRSKVGKALGFWSQMNDLR